MATVGTPPTETMEQGKRIQIGLQVLGWSQQQPVPLAPQGVEQKGRTVDL